MPEKERRRSKPRKLREHNTTGHGSSKKHVIERVLNPHGYFPESKNSLVSDANRLNGIVVLLVNEYNPELRKIKDPKERKTELYRAKQIWLRKYEHDPEHARLISAYTTMRNIQNRAYSELKNPPRMFELSDRFEYDPETRAVRTVPYEKKK